MKKSQNSYRPTNWFTWCCLYCVELCLKSFLLVRTVSGQLDIHLISRRIETHDLISSTTKVSNLTCTPIRSIMNFNEITCTVYIQRLKLQGNFLMLRNSDCPGAFRVWWVIPREIGGLELARFSSQDWFAWRWPIGPKSCFKSLFSPRTISRELDIQLVAWWGEISRAVSTAKWSNFPSICISTIINLNLIILAIWSRFKLKWKWVPLVQLLYYVHIC